MDPKDVPACVMDHMLMHLFSRVSDSAWKKPVDCGKIIIGYLNSPIVAYQGLKPAFPSPFVFLPSGYEEYVNEALEGLKEVEKL